MDGVLNLSAFGEVIENPEKKATKVMEPKVPVKQEDPYLSKNPDHFTFNQFRKIPTDPKETVETKQTKIAHKILKNTAQVKLFHWQTGSYAEHKTLDKFFVNFLDLSDFLMESVMGKYGKPNLSGDHNTLEMVNYNSQSMLNFMDLMHECYSGEIKNCFDPKEDGELINTVDEILALINKTKYLLTLK